MEGPVHVYLESPLDGRPVIDGVTGKCVPYRNVSAEIEAADARSRPNERPADDDGRGRLRGAVAAHRRLDLGAQEPPVTAEISRRHQAAASPVTHRRILHGEEQGHLVGRHEIRAGEAGFEVGPISTQGRPACALTLAGCTAIVSTCHP